MNLAPPNAGDRGVDSSSVGGIGVALSRARDREIDAFRARAADWLAREKPQHLPDAFTERIQQLQAWQQKLYDAGWLGLAWPKEYGGQGLTMLEQLVFTEEMARARAPMPAGVVSLEVVGPTILHVGSQQQKAELLPPLLRGDVIWSQGFSEPDSGSDLASLQTRARREGDHYVVSGRKVWTTLAQFSSRCALLARTDPDAPPHKGISYLLVDLKVPGVTIRPIREMTGDPSFSEVIYDEVKVPVENILGAENEGWAVAMTTLAYERGPYVIRRNAELRAAFEDLVEVLRPLPLAKDPHIQRRCGEIEILLEALQARCGVITEDVLAARTGVQSSLDRVFLTQVEQELFAFAVDVLGPNRMSRTSEVPDPLRWSRDYLYSRAASIYSGTAEIQRNIIAQRLLGLPRS